MDDIATGEESTCTQCHQRITAVIDPYSGVTDWGARGDFGCDTSPDTNEEGTGSHNPGPGHTPLGFKFPTGKPTTSVIEERDFHVSVTVRLSTNVGFAPIERDSAITSDDALANFYGMGLGALLDSGEYGYDVSDITVTDANREDMI